MTLAARSIEPSPAAAPPLRVLLVEDNEVDALVAQAAVEKAARGPAAVLRADTLARGLEIARSGDVHLVLLDLNLPDSRGLDTLERMRGATRCPIIVVTIDDRPGLDADALALGAFEILHKDERSAGAVVPVVRLAERQRDYQDSLRHSILALRQSEARFRSLTELSADWYWEQDENFRFVDFSSSVEAHGSSPASHIGKARWELPFVGVSEEQWAEHRAALEAHQPFHDFEYQRVTERGDTIWMSASGTPIFDEQGRFKGYRGIGRNITDRKRAEARLAHLAQFDPVTGLPNRALLTERLEQAIAQARRHGRSAGVLFVDLDHFKLINDTLGHAAGDELLARTGKRLKDCVRPDDTVARLSGDEFAVVVADLARTDDAALVARKIVDYFAAPFDLFGQEAYVTTSIGVAAFPNDGDSADALLKSAHTAMYRVKESSRNAFCFFAADMNERAASKLKLHTDLRHALERREFQLHYQPKVELASGAMIGMESLLRWKHPARGMVSPAEFIPALEDTGLIVPVGDWVIEEARSQLRKWTLDGLQAVPIAVNLSAKQFGRRDLDQVIRRLLAEQGISPQLLDLEITESCLMDDPKDAIRQLAALREAGFTISVDDFGTGYSSLAYLTRLPLSTLKIDRGFVDAAISDPSAAAIVKMVIDMAQSLRFGVVAEGIESEEHVAFLRQHGCEQGQGYHFGKPMPSEAIASRLAKL